VTYCFPVTKNKPVDVLPKLYSIGWLYRCSLLFIVRQTVKSNMSIYSLYIYNSIFSACPSRFTHANRHCTEHPYASLRRISTQEQIRDRMQTLKFSPNQSVTEWITRYDI